PSACESGSSPFARGPADAPSRSVTVFWISKRVSRRMRTAGGAGAAAPVTHVGVAGTPIPAPPVVAGAPAPPTPVDPIGPGAAPAAPEVAPPPVAPPPPMTPVQARRSGAHS